MQFYRMLGTLLLLIALMVREGQTGDKKVIIHVPVHIKKLKHTHTIYKIIHVPVHHHHHDHHKEHHVEHSHHDHHDHHGHHDHHDHHGHHHEHHDHHDHHDHHWAGHSQSVQNHW